MLRAVEMLPIRDRVRNLWPALDRVREAFTCILARIVANQN
jgi:hypothetical protein